MVIWISKYEKYIYVNTIKGDYRYIIECKDNYIIEEFKTILDELSINYMLYTHSIMISYRDYDFDKIGGINVFIDQCKCIINHKYKINRIKKQLTI